MALLAVAGCGGSDKSSSPQGGYSLPSPTPTTTTRGGIDPLEGAGTTPVVGAPTGSETALLDRIAVGRHEGYDRVVFQFQNSLPGYRIEYVQPPLKEDGSGNPVSVQGNAIVLVRMEPASGFDLNTAEADRRRGGGYVRRAGARPHRRFRSGAELGDRALGQG